MQYQIQCRRSHVWALIKPSYDLHGFKSGLGITLRAETKDNVSRWERCQGTYCIVPDSLMTTSGS